MTVFLDDGQYEAITAALDCVLPSDDNSGAPGAARAGAVAYIDQLLGAFSFDPPRIWAGGPFSGRHGGDAQFDQWMELSPLEELAWRTRIEGSLGRVEREFNGPVVGLQERYVAGIAALGDDFAELETAERRRRLDALPEFRDLLFAHGCEGLYGDPVYGGNRDALGWSSIGFEGDVQPRGYTDDEVRLP